MLITFACPLGNGRTFCKSVQFFRSQTPDMRAITACLLIILVNSGFSAYLGKYRARMESVRDFDDIPRDKIDWKLFLRKLNRTEQVLDGYMNIKERVGPLELTLKLEKWADGAYKKFLTDGMTTNNVCIDKEFKVIMDNYNGTTTPECIFEPEIKYLKPFNIDVEMHKHVQQIVYGKYRIGIRFHANGRDLMGFQVIIVYEKLKQ